MIEAQILQVRDSANLLADKVAPVMAVPAAADGGDAAQQRRETTALEPSKLQAREGTQIGGEPTAQRHTQDPVETPQTPNEGTTPQEGSNE